MAQLKWIYIRYMLFRILRQRIGSIFKEVQGTLQRASHKLY